MSDHRTPEQLAIERKVRTAARSVGLVAKHEKLRLIDGEARPSGWQLHDAAGLCVIGEGFMLTTEEALAYCSRPR